MLCPARASGVQREILPADRSVVKQGKTPKQCLEEKDKLPLQCQHLLLSFVDCRKGLVSVTNRGKACTSR